jgi:hypothetical protein
VEENMKEDDILQAAKVSVEEAHEQQIGFNETMTHFNENQTTLAFAPTPTAFDGKQKALEEELRNAETTLANANNMRDKLVYKLKDNKPSLFSAQTIRNSGISGSGETKEQQEEDFMGIVNLFLSSIVQQYGQQYGQQYDLHYLIWLHVKTNINGQVVDRARPVERGKAYVKTPGSYGFTSGSSKNPPPTQQRAARVTKRRNDLTEQINHMLTSPPTIEMVPNSNTTSLNQPISQKTPVELRQKPPRTKRPRGWLTTNNTPIKTPKTTGNRLLLPPIITSKKNRGGGKKKSKRKKRRKKKKTKRKKKKRKKKTIKRRRKKNKKTKKKKR